jgi:threonine synthase
LRRYVCTQCEATHAPDATRWRCDCGGWLDLGPAGAGDDPDPVSLGEGATAVALATIGGRVVRAKLEFLSPTLSFKDRGAASLVGLARAVAARRLVADSSGNAGTALAAYAARAGLPMEVFVPASTSASKLAQMAAHGAEVVAVEGDRTAAATAAIARVEQGDAFYASHVYNPWFWEGTKRFVCELSSDGPGLPDVLVVPVGNGTLVLGAHRALRELGALDRCRIVAVQSSACAPIAAAFAAGLDHVPPVTDRGTVAEGIAIAAPARGADVLAAVRATSGRVVTVTDEETAAVADELARQGLFVEPTAAAGAAGVLRLTDSEAAAGVVVPLCGAGLKAVSPARRATPGSARRGTG